MKTGWMWIVSLASVPFTCLCASGSVQEDDDGGLVHQRAIKILNELHANPASSEDTSTVDDYLYELESKPRPSLFWALEYTGLLWSTQPATLQNLWDFDMDLSSYDQLPREEVMQNLPEPENKDPIAEKTRKCLLLLHVAAFKLLHEPSALFLADVYLDGGYGQKRNVRKAFDMNHHLAHQFASPKGQRMVGLMYASGIAQPRNYAKAQLYLSFAAVAGDVIASQALGYWHLAGIGTAKNCEDAVWHIQQVGEQVIHTYESGPPLGRRMPAPTKVNLPDKFGGVYGRGASGKGNPSFHSSKSSSSLSQQDIFQYYEYTADKGDIDAQLTLGQLYYLGTSSIKRDFGKAFSNFRKLAEQHPRLKNPSIDDSTPELKSRALAAATAVGYLGSMYWRGEGLKQDNDTARQWFEQGVQWGDAVSMNALGIMYMDGSGGLPVDQQKAQKLFSEAALKENADALVNMGEIHFAKKDYANAVKYYSSASRHGNIKAIYRLGEAYSSGLGVAKSCHNGFGFYKTIVEKGDWHMPWIREAQAAFKDGDMETAVLKYVLAAELGYETAQTNAAWILDQGMYDVINSSLFPETDRYIMALNLWNRAANQGNVDARVKMGDYHYYGLGTEKKADAPEDTVIPQTRSWLDKFQWLKRIVHPYEPTGYPDLEKAAMYYQVAAELEYSSMAMWNLGWMHEHGIGVEQDLHLAKRLYDQCLVTNPDAYMPVNIGLLILYAKFFWASLVGGAWLWPSDSSETSVSSQLPPLPELTPDDASGNTSFLMRVINGLIDEQWEGYLIVALGLIAGVLVYLRHQQAMQPAARRLDPLSRRDPRPHHDQQQESPPHIVQQPILHPQSPASASRTERLEAQATTDPSSSKSEEKESMVDREPQTQASESS